MCVAMETWLLADHSALKQVFGPKLDASKLPSEGTALEQMDKAKVYAALDAAIKPTPAGAYSKGSHSFKVLAEVTPNKLRTLPWAKRFLDAMGSASAKGDETRNP